MDWETITTSFLWDKEILERFALIADILNTLIVPFGLLLVILQLRRMRIDRDQSNLSCVFERLSDHNNNIINDDFRKRAVDMFSALRCNYTAEEYNLYWGARSIHLSHLNLLTQVWLLAGKPKRLTEEYEGWELFAKLVADEIKGLTSASKPQWYKDACDDLLAALNGGMVYPSDFGQWLLSK